MPEEKVVIGEVAGRRRQRAANRPRLMDSGINFQDLGPGTPVCVYIRVSTEEQTENFSLGAQERVCRDFAKQKGWEVVKVYEDPGHSGKNDKRPGFQALMFDAEVGLFKVVLVHKLDRFSRNLENTLKNFKTLNSHNVTLTSVTEMFDYSTPMGRVAFHMMAAFAQWYLENLSQEVVKGKEEMARKGIHNGRIPFGYEKDLKGKINIVPGEAESIQKAFEMYSTGEYTDREIAEYLDRNGYKTRRRRIWSKDTVRDLLQNEFYYGMIVHRNLMYNGRHEGIISKGLFTRCQEVRREHASQPRALGASTAKGGEAAGNGGQPKQFYLLQRVICCSKCERPLRMQSSGKFFYYKDASRERGLDCDHAGKTIKMDLADQMVLDMLARFHLPEKWQEQIEKMANDMDRLVQMEKRREQIQSQLERLSKVYIDTPNMMTDAEYERRRNVLATELNSLVAPDGAAMMTAALQMDSLGPFLEEATEGEKAEIIHLLLDAIYVDLESKKILRIRPRSDFLPIFQMSAAGLRWREDIVGEFIIQEANKL
jgi:site-specific DNA recombinase